MQKHYKLAENDLNKVLALLFFNSGLGITQRTQQQDVANRTLRERDQGVG